MPLEITELSLISREGGTPTLSPPLPKDLPAAESMHLSAWTGCRQELGEDQGRGPVIGGGACVSACQGEDGELIASLGKSAAWKKTAFWEDPVAGGSDASVAWKPVA